MKGLLRKLRLRWRLELDDNDPKTPKVQCPNCNHTWRRKPSKVEQLAQMAGDISTKELLYIYRNFCAGCEEHFKSINEATIDHVQPKSKGGKNGLHNYQLLCQSCNIRKGNKWSGGYDNPTVKLAHLLDNQELQSLINKKAHQESHVQTN